MAERKHTPGPWRMRKDGGVETVDGRMVPHSSAWREDAWQGDWATDESQANDALIASAPTLRSEVARLTAEVEAMREVVEAARETTTTRSGKMLPVLNRIYLALAALDALRARKVGG